MSGTPAETPRPAAPIGGDEGASGYEAPSLTRLGDLSELTLVMPKTVGAADGATFLGVDIGS